MRSRKRSISFSTSFSVRRGMKAAKVFPLYVLISQVKTLQRLNARRIYPAAGAIGQTDIYWKSGTRRRAGGRTIQLKSAAGTVAPWSPGLTGREFRYLQIMKSTQQAVQRGGARSRSGVFLVDTLTHAARAHALERLRDDSPPAAGRGGNGTVLRIIAWKQAAERRFRASVLKRFVTPLSQPLCAPCPGFE